MGSNPTGCTKNMKIYTLKFRQKINRNINDVFNFFSNPENLAHITPSKLNFKILTPLPIKMKEGQLIDYTITILGKKIRWRTIISEYESPKYFIDQQLKGPYSMWHHKHEFEDRGEYVEIIDTVNYVVPFGIIGRLVNFLFIHNDLDKIFKYRKKVIEKYFRKEVK